ncbi:MAG: dipeptidase PepE [Syntrophothermus sp.]
MKRKLLLISNSTNPGEEYLGWPRSYIKIFIEKHSIQDFLFIPWAGINLSQENLHASYDVYTRRVTDVFNELGCRIHSIHLEKDPVAAVEAAKAIMVGGGNTFHLVGMMHKEGIMDKIREKVLSGVPYMGWSAGANVACPTMKTTNDMPVFEPASFNCLGLIPFQINPHYLDANPAGHGGETREQRINEFLAINWQVMVTGLRETTLLEVTDDDLQLKGAKSMRLFRFGKEPEEYQPGEDINFLL